MIYLFELGRNHELSRSEIEQIFLSQKISYKIFTQEKQNLFVETESPLEIQPLMQKLGGTIKIAEQILPEKNLEKFFHILATLQTGKIQFSISGNEAKDFAFKAKKQLKAMERSVRYIEPKNTATILHNNLLEKQGDFTLTKHGIFLTRAVQLIEDWGERDFGRPGRDSRSGMLPPKLARILINLAGGQKKSTLLDPFCGSGTVLTEAMTLGFENIIGSDLSEKAIKDSQKNIDWTKEQNTSTKNIKTQLILADASQIQKYIAKNTVDIIATEPYMGKPLRGTEAKQQLLSQGAELKTLFLKAFEAFHKVLRPGGVVVFIIPRFLCQNEWIGIDCTEAIQNMGFSLERLTQTTPFILYHRPDQFVGREVWKFQKIG